VGTARLLFSLSEYFGKHLSSVNISFLIRPSFDSCVPMRWMSAALFYHYFPVLSSVSAILLQLTI
jgi:hypothetical protein